MRPFEHAIANLEQDIMVAETNAPIYEAEGDLAQASLCRQVAEHSREALFELENEA
jgi:hypothetical protein